MSPLSARRKGESEKGSPARKGWLVGERRRRWAREGSRKRSASTTSFEFLISKPPCNYWINVNYDDALCSLAAAVAAAAGAAGRMAGRTFARAVDGRKPGGRRRLPALPTRPGGGDGGAAGETRGAGPG